MVCPEMFSALASIHAASRTPQRNGTSINICPLDRRAVNFQFKLDNEEIRK
jgi:hypothetical protein